MLFCLHRWGGWVEKFRALHLVFLLYIRGNEYGLIPLWQAKRFGADKK
jgi:hypothetical protein